MTSSPVLHAGLAGLALVLALSVPCWLASLLRRDASLADRFWPLLIVAPALPCTLLLDPAMGPGTRGFWMLALLLAWALRLGVFITWRNWGHGEDRRYRDMRARNQPHFGLKSLGLVFSLQALLAWVVSASLLAGLAGSRPLGWLDGVGFGLAAFGASFEAVADAQMARFQSDPVRHGKVMDRGLWRFSRHPNYFGECCVWWGLWLMALSAGGLGAAWSVVSPALMTFLLLHVSGVALLEKDIAERRPAYRDYVARTPAFVPWRPRRPRHGEASTP